MVCIQNYCKESTGDLSCLQRIKEDEVSSLQEKTKNSGDGGCFQDERYKICHTINVVVSVTLNTELVSTFTCNAAFNMNVW